jgi:hypothetical protein
MNKTEFEQYLKLTRADTPSSDSEKILSFIRWCNTNRIEELIIRLSTESRNWKGSGCFLDFTTSRLIISKKSFIRKFFDTGFVAGMAPLPYALLAGENVPDFKKGTALDPSDIVEKDRSSFYFRYSEIEEIHLRRGVETTITNMLGSAINTNFITIKTKDGNQYSYGLPVRKNGSFEKMYYWLNTISPVKVSLS